MSKLEIFIVRAYVNGMTSDSTIASFKDKADKFTVVDSLFEVNEIDKEREWFGVFYENEVITDELLEALESFFMLTEADVLVAFKKEKNGRVTKCPRFFRKDVELSIDSLNPEDRTVVHEIILNGVIKEQ